MAQIELLQPTEKIKDSYGKINTSLTNLNNNKLEKSGDTMTGLLTTLGGIDLEVSSVPTGKVGRMHANGATNQIYYHDGTDWREVWHHGNNPASLAGNGYQKLASGLILQWAKATVQSGDTFTYPVAFPNAVLAISATADSFPAIKVSVAGIANSVCFIHHENGSTPTDIFIILIGW